MPQDNSIITIGYYNRGDKGTVAQKPDAYATVKPILDVRTFDIEL